MRFALLLCFLAATALAQTNPLAGDQAAIDVGKGNFRIYCAPCHGIHAEGGRGPDLTRGSFTAGDTDADLFHVVTSGVPGTEMAGYSGQFDEQGIWRLIAFIRSAARVANTPVPGDIRAGHEVFWGKGGCAGCHAVGMQGGTLGPALTKVGRQRSLEYLRDKLLTPDKDITPGYQTLSVKLRDGAIVRGIEKNFDDFSAILLDSNRQFRSFRKEDVASMQRESRSLMPDDYGHKLSATEQTDLLAYLASLKGEK